DDDVWVFVNGQLGVDLGGVHGPLTGNIDMDAVAGAFDLQLGQVYALDFFSAERHTTLSNFNIATTISCFDPP
ncbi:MAG TPA: fibro-slime domain-containing protein, partial [Enhygromyxa sp.]|nr:fibro-slime domain-containing protein [Enhygromyxa sp.]